MYSTVRQTIGFVLLLFLHILGNTVQAQVQCAYDPPTRSALARQQARLVALKAALAADKRGKIGGMTYIPIRAHIVRNTDGTGGVDPGTLPTVISRLNQRYESMGLSFFLRGTTPHYIDDSQYVSFDETEEDALCNPNDVSNAINLYLVQTITAGGVSVAGYAYYPEPDAYTNRIICISGTLLTSVTLPHELGHYFNLNHTFQDNDHPDASQRELVTRGAGANCLTTGDYLCDTPADPFGLANTGFSNCQYIGTATDANGAPFSPLIDNIMSYYGACRQAFTAGQYAWMNTGVTLRLDGANEYNLTQPGYVLATPQWVQLTAMSGGVRLDFQYPATDAAGFLIERATDPNGPFISIGGVGPAATTFTDPSPVRLTRNYYRIRPANASGQYSDVWSVDVGLVFCMPSYSSSAGTAPAHIAQFKLTGTTLDNQSGEWPAERYNDYSGVAHLVNPGQMYSFLVNTTSSGASSFVAQHLTIWLDLNRDGTLATTEILFQTPANQPFGSSLIGMITIPSSVSGQTGRFRLRVRTRYSAEGVVSSPCDQYTYGETEDYSLRVMSFVCPTIAVSQTLTAIRCADERNGAVQFEASAGTSPYSYRLGSLSNQSGRFTGLSAQAYALTVTDAEGCTATHSVSLTNPVPFVVSIAGSTTFCDNSATTLTALVASGGPAIRYNWSSNETSAKINVAQAGTYTLTAYNEAGCSSTAIETVTAWPCAGDDCRKKGVTIAHTRLRSGD